MKILRLLTVALSAAFFIAGSAFAQNSGTVTNHAFVLGKGAGQTGFTSLLCTSAQLAVGQAAADPICRTITGDVTLSAAGATAIGATKVTSAMLNADVFSTAHTWAGQQTFVAPILGTPASGTLTNATGLPLSGLTAQAAYTIVANNSGSSAVPTAVSVPAITAKATPVSADIILIQDSAASNAFKRTTLGALGSAGLVGSFNALTGTVATSVTKQVFGVSGTYTPTAGMLHAIIECVGGGGGGSGAAGQASGVMIGGGGQAGGYSRKYVTAADIGASKTVTIGAAGTAGAAANGTGGTGGATSVGTLCIANGGIGGSNGGAGGVAGTGAGAGTGDYAPAGSPGSGGIFQTITSVNPSGGAGGNSHFGGGGAPQLANANSVGLAGTANTGGGGGGGAVNGSATSQAGGAGAAGVVIITEFVNL